MQFLEFYCSRICLFRETGVLETPHSPSFDAISPKQKLEIRLAPQGRLVKRFKRITISCNDSAYKALSCYPENPKFGSHSSELLPTASLTSDILILNHFTQLTSDNGSSIIMVMHVRPHPFLHTQLLQFSETKTTATKQSSILCSLEVFKSNVSPTYRSKQIAHSRQL